MAGAARIGALHIMLGLDSADFTNGMKKANTGLDKFTRAAKIGFAAVAVAAAAAGTALAVAVKGAIDNADELSKTAQKVGVTTEALSQLKYAADLSDVSLQQLSTGLGRLTQSMSQIAQGAQGPAKMAFDALGIAAQTATGQLRASDEVFADVAEKFAAMEDGSTKTALAIALFGRSGADLIPMLNMGKAGLADLAAEADRLGITLSTSTGKAAEQFNDTITRLQATFQGVINKIMEGALPTLNELGDKLADPQFAASAQAIGVAIVESMKMAVDAVNTVVGAFNALRDAMSWMITHDMFGNDTGGNGAGKGFIKFNTEEEAAEILRGKLASGETGGPGADFYNGIFGAPAAEVVSQAQEVVTAFEPVIANTREAAAGASALKTAMSEGLSVFEATRTPAEKYALEVERLNKLLQQGAIDQDTYNRAIIQAQDAFKGAEVSGNEFATTLSDGLTGIFGAVISGSDDAMGAVESLIQALAKLAIQKGFEMLLGAAFGGGNFMGGTFGAPALKLGFQTGVPGFANGTNFAPGGLAMVGEQGPELVNLPRGSQVIPNHELAGLGGGLTVNVDARGAQMGVAEQIDQWARFQLPQIVNRINSDPLARG